MATMHYTDCIKFAEIAVANDDIEVTDRLRNTYREYFPAQGLKAAFEARAPQIFEYLFQNQPFAKRLFQHPIQHSDPSQICISKQPFLLHAACHGDYEWVDRLIRLGADPYQYDIGRDTTAVSFAQDLISMKTDPAKGRKLMEILAKSSLYKEDKLYHNEVHDKKLEDIETSKTADHFYWLPKHGDYIDISTEHDSKLKYLVDTFTPQALAKFCWVCRHYRGLAFGLSEHGAHFANPGNYPDGFEIFEKQLIKNNMACRMYPMPWELRVLASPERNLDFLYDDPEVFSSDDITSIDMHNDGAWNNPFVAKAILKRLGPEGSWKYIDWLTNKYPNIGQEVEAKLVEQGLSPRK